MNSETIKFVDEELSLFPKKLIKKHKNRGKNEEEYVRGVELVFAKGIEIRSHTVERVFFTTFHRDMDVRQMKMVLLGRMMVRLLCSRIHDKGSVAKVCGDTFEERS